MSGSTLRVLDSHQQIAVETTGNAVVAAGAGSGKTTVLSRRYLDLVRHRGAQVSSILTLTFTRKAAAEMHDRIYRLLLSQREDPVVDRAVAGFDDSQISTLDSFCLQIAREKPGLFGLPAEFSIDDERVTSAARDIATEFVTRHARHETLREFVRMNGFGQVLDEFFGALASRYLHIAGTHDFEGMYRHQLQVLETECEEAISRITAIASEMLDLDSGAGSTVEKARAMAGELASLPELQQSGKYAEIASLLVSAKTTKPGSNVKKPDLLRLRELIESYRPYKDAAVGMAETMVDADLIGEVMSLCGEFETLVQTRRRELGVCSFEDVVRMAVRILTDDLTVRSYYQHRFRYIMIDEFQDNNAVQRDLLYLLAGNPESGEEGRVPGPDELTPGKLFFVGDQKQSIYRFRGADVTVFKGLSREIADHGGDALALPVNYRSVPGLISVFNRIFSRMMPVPGAPAETDNPLEFEAEFEPLEAGRGLSDSPTDRFEVAPCGILYKPYDRERADGLAGSDDAEAMAIAELIEDLTTSCEIPDGAGARRVTYDDVAILMRSTSNQIRYERVLRSRGIPHTVESARSLFLESIFNDCYALLQLIVYPADRSSFLALLRSPLIAVSDSAALMLLQSGAIAFDADPAIIDCFEESDRCRYREGETLYRRMCELAADGTIIDLVSAFWYEEGYRYHLLVHPEYHGYLEHYDYLRALASDADGRGESLVEFLDFLRDNLGKYERLKDLELLGRTQTGVRIMTVHKSKGLEFPVVIFANTGNVGRPHDTSAPFYLSDEFGLTVNIRRTSKSNYFYRRAQEETEAKELAELKRLIYVACTRAEHRLYISGCHNRNNRERLDAPLNLILRAIGWDGTTPVLEDPSLADMVREIPDVEEASLYATTGGSRGRSLQEGLEAYRNRTPIEYPTAERREWAATEIGPPISTGRRVEEASPVHPETAELLEEEGEASIFGTLCHEMLAALVDGVDGEAIIAVENGTASSPCPAVLEVVSRFPQDRRVAIARAALQVCRDVYEDILSAMISGAAVESEVPFTLQMTERARVRGRIDTIIDDGSQITIVDYKTDAVIDVESHRYQLELYRRAAESWYDRPVRACLVYVLHNRMIELPDGLDLVFPWDDAGGGR